MASTKYGSFSHHAAHELFEIDSNGEEEHGILNNSSGVKQLANSQSNCYLDDDADNAGIRSYGYQDTEFGGTDDKMNVYSITPNIYGDAGDEFMQCAV